MLSILKWDTVVFCAIMLVLYLLSFVSTPSTVGYISYDVIHLFPAYLSLLYN